jgi:hypothetical protein
VQKREKRCAYSRRVDAGELPNPITHDAKNFHSRAQNETQARNRSVELFMRVEFERSDAQ